MCPYKPTCVHIRGIKLAQGLQNIHKAWVSLFQLCNNTMLVLFPPLGPQSIIMKCVQKRSEQIFHPICEPHSSFKCRVQDERGKEVYLDVQISCHYVVLLAKLFRDRNSQLQVPMSTVQIMMFVRYSLVKLEELYKMR